MTITRPQPIGLAAVSYSTDRKAPMTHPLSEDSAGYQGCHIPTGYHFHPLHVRDPAQTGLEVKKARKPPLGYGWRNPTSHHLLSSQARDVPQRVSTRPQTSLASVRHELYNTSQLPNESGVAVALTI
jgi:hypothetical protein